MGLIVPDYPSKMTSLTSEATGGNRHLQNNPNKSTTTEPRKKRTFDIAFLTGQSEKCESPNNHRSSPNSFKESNNNNNVHSHFESKSNSNKRHITSPSSYFPSNSTSSPISISSVDDQDHHRAESPYNLSHRDVSVSSDTSSMIDVDVDVMTNSNSNGSFSDSTEDRVDRNVVNPRVLLSLSQSHYNNHQNHHHHHQNHSKIYPSVKSKVTKGKNAYTKNSPVKEEIRFESKRTIDINHTQDSLKIKENLQFSTLIPTNSLQSPPQHLQIQNLQNLQQLQHSQSQDFNDFLLPPHIASTFALFPHISKFPQLPLPVNPLGHQHHNSHNSHNSHHNQSNINTINPNSTTNPNNSNHGQNHPQGQSQTHSTPQGHHRDFSSKEKSDSLGHPSHSHQQNNPYLSNSSKMRHQNQHPHHPHFPDLYPAYPYPNLILPPQFSPPSNLQLQLQGQSSNQHSPSGGATLLPPSLTALTLPAQNVCAKCNIGFRMTSDLVYHMRSHHKRDTFDPLKKQREEKLKCPVCHESFRERHHLTRHMTAHQDRGDEIGMGAGANGQPSLAEGFGGSTGNVISSGSKLVV